MQNALPYFSHAGYNRFGALPLIPDAAFDHFVFPRRRIQLHRKPSAPLSPRAPPTAIFAVLRRANAAYNDPRRSSLSPSAAHDDSRHPPPDQRRLQRFPAPLYLSRRRLRRSPALLSLPGRRPRRFSPSDAGPTPPTTTSGAPLPLRAPPAAISGVLRRADAAYDVFRRLFLPPGAAYVWPSLRRFSLSSAEPTPPARIPGTSLSLGAALRRFLPSSAGPTLPRTIPGAPLYLRAPPTETFAVRRRANAAHDGPRRLSLPRDAANGDFRRFSASSAGPAPPATTSGASSPRAPPTAIFGVLRRAKSAHNDFRRPFLSSGAAYGVFSPSSAGPTPLTTISGATSPPFRRRIRSPASSSRS